MISNDPLLRFHPLVQTWFRNQVGMPTEIQREAWIPIADGKHVLLTAPTGSGKTLTAFLWALDRFLSGAWPPGSTRVLYISPLKALNNDIQRNLLTPLNALREVFSKADVAIPEIRVLVRSGDTPATERRRMLKKPPEILITTPESLNLLLLTAAGRDSLCQISVVILDEIHAVAASKRGVHLITAIDRLVPIAGEFQRIALSATVKPLDLVAAFVGGSILGESGYVPRTVVTVVSRTPKIYTLQVRYAFDPNGAGGPSGNAEPNQEHEIWGSIALEIKRMIATAGSTLIFANSRRMAERLARLLNDGEPAPIAYAHHGSLSREIRAVVEERMKQGLLPAIVATNSLELGIDIGALNQVILVQTPFSIASAMQKIGRAGHGVGQVSRGQLFASHGLDAVDAAVAVQCIERGDIEDLRLVQCPLDLLAQILVSMAVTEAWSLDRLFAFIRTSHPYRDLTRVQFDLVVEMLTGRFEETRIRELRPRLSVDAVDGKVRAVKGAAFVLAMNSGTIADRGYYALRHSESRAKIGELDEEFVWERRAGEIFALGNRSWKIIRITANEVEVIPAGRDAQMAPFWRAEERDRGFHFSNRLGVFLADADGSLEDATFSTQLSQSSHMDIDSAEAVATFLKKQKSVTKASLPHRHHLVVEDAGSAPGTDGNRQVILHAIWGGRLNRPWAYALAAAWEARTGLQIEIIPGDDCLLVQLPPGESATGLLDWVHADNLETLLRNRLEQTGYFAAHFRENASRALLLPKSNFKNRVPLWISRLRSQGLHQAVSRFSDFPIVLETWRECLRDEFDLITLKMMLGEIQSGAIKISEVHTHEPSPFAQGVLWKQTNANMYAGSKPAEGAKGPSEDLLREVAFSSPLRPKIPREIIEDFVAKAQRVAPLYAPDDAITLLDWVKERVLIPWSEWLKLWSLNKETPDEYLEERIIGIQFSRPVVDGKTIEPGSLVVAIETLPQLLEALSVQLSEMNLFSPFSSLAPSTQTMSTLNRLLQARKQNSDSNPPDMGALISQWLRCYGPVPIDFIKSIFGRHFQTIQVALEDLSANSQIVMDKISEVDKGIGAEVDSNLEVCDAANLELLLRLLRRRSRPTFETLPVEKLPLFLASWQGLTDPATNVEDFQTALEKLFGYPASASHFETEILPARMVPYRSGILDELFRDTDLAWFGCGQEKIALAFAEDLDLFAQKEPVNQVYSSEQDLVLKLLTQAAPSRLDYQALSTQCPIPSDRLVESLWNLSWQGRITNDTFAALRKGIETQFKFDLPTPIDPVKNLRGRGRNRFQGWKATRPLAGAWRVLNPVNPESDLLEVEEIQKDRVRQVLRRYGILFRGLLDQELPSLNWSALFRTLRLMELSGEVLSGHFFAGISGLQFLSPQALRNLSAPLPEDAVYWMCATDPASPCALGLEGLPYHLPSRLPSNHLLFHGSNLVMISKKMGRELLLRVSPRDRYVPGYLSALKNLVERSVLPVKSIEVEKVNEEEAVTSPYLEDFLSAGFEKGIKSLSLRKRY